VGRREVPAAPPMNNFAVAKNIAARFGWGGLGVFTIRVAWFSTPAGQVWLGHGVVISNSPQIPRKPQAEQSGNCRACKWQQTQNQTTDRQRPVKYPVTSRSTQ
jgi:hypothetical protein